MAALVVAKLAPRPSSLSERNPKLHDWRETRQEEGPLEKPDDNRTRAQRDRDRILYSSAFRRLNGVTQVVSSQEEGYLLHNRLTHSLKVAQVARRIAEYLIDSAATEKREDKLDLGGGVDPDVVESAALAHDLGHPPFGHIGENELQKLVKASLDDSFEGNAQSFRTVNVTALVRKDLPGLNLTRASLAAILKYPWRRDEYPWKSTHEATKWGAYDAIPDRAALEFVRAGSVVPANKRTLEAEIMDWADDIAYAVHDVEDFYRAGFVPLERLSKDAPDKRRTHDIEELARRAKVRWDKNPDKAGEVTEEQLVDAARGTVMLFEFDAPWSGSRDDHMAVRTAMSTLTGRYVRSSEVDDEGHLYVPKEWLWQIAVLKELTWMYVIENPALATQQHGQRIAIGRVFQVFADAACSDKADARGILPGRLQEELELAGVKATQATRVRLVTDTISAMTEQQVSRLYRRLTGVDTGALRDPAVM